MGDGRGLNPATPISFGCGIRWRRRRRQSALVCLLRHARWDGKKQREFYTMDLESQRWEEELAATYRGMAERAGCVQAQQARARIHGNLVPFAPSPLHHNPSSGSFPALVMLMSWQT